MSKLLSGLKSWYYQRLTAVFLILVFFYLLVSLITLDLSTYSAWLQWVKQFHNQIILMLATLATVVHAWVGFRDIVLDYIKPPWFKLLLLNLAAISLIALTLWFSLILFTNVH